MSAAAIVRTKYPDASFIAAHYSDDFNLNDLVNDGDTVIIVDFSIEPEMMKDVLKKADEVIWLDHHISAIKKYEGFEFDINGTRDISKAATMLTWEFFYPDDEAPQAIKYVNDFDIFEFKYGAKSKQFISASALYDIGAESEFWEKLIKGDKDLLKEVLDKGKISYEWEMDSYRSIANSVGYEILYDGMIAYCINTKARGYYGDVVKKMGYNLVFCYQYDGENYRFSVYSRDDDIDASKIAEKFGGGGHKGASGFSVKEIPEEFLKKYERSVLITEE